MVNLKRVSLFRIYFDFTILCICQGDDEADVQDDDSMDDMDSKLISFRWN